MEFVMAFGSKRAAAGVSADRLGAVMNGAASAGAAGAQQTVSQPRRRVSVEPDVSRMRKNAIDETPEERSKRLAAKSINFGTTFAARAIIIAALAYYAWNAYQYSGNVHRGVAVAMFAMFADFGRVALKALEPGSK